LEDVRHLTPEELQARFGGQKLIVTYPMALTADTILAGGHINDKLKKENQHGSRWKRR